MEGIALYFAGRGLSKRHYSIPVYSHREDGLYYPLGFG